MRHRRKIKKLGRSTSHRKALVSMLVTALIKQGRIETTVVKAKVARSEGEKLLTLARKGTLASRRLVASRLRDEDAAKKLFEEIAPKFIGRNGGYTRVVKTSYRKGDAAQQAILMWIDPNEPKREKPKKVEKAEKVEKPQKAEKAPSAPAK